MAVRNKKIIEDALKPEEYFYGISQVPKYEDKWNKESQYNTHSVDEDFMSKMQDAEKRGDLEAAAYWERVRNEKIGLGYGGQYSPTYKYNYNPSENRAKADDIREKLMEYDKFDYDPQNDAAYKALTNVYHRNAKAASENALARAAAANGGRLSSNAIIAANLGYQDKMAGLEAEIPQLRQAAYNMHRDKKNDLRQMAYDYDTLEAENYNRWADDYTRRYTNTLDMLKRQDAEREREDNKDTLAYNRAYTMAQSLGYVTDDLSALTGIPSGTPFETAKQYLTNLQASVQSDMGSYSREWLDSQGMPYVEEGPTLSSKQLDATVQNNLWDYEIGKLANQPYDPYADETPDGDPPGTKPSIAQMAAEINADPTVTSENVESVVEQYASMHGLSEEEMIELYNSLNV